MASREEAAILEIAESFPGIMRQLFGKVSVVGGVREFTFPQMQALGFVVDHPGCTMGELAQALGIGLSAATGLIDRLVQHEFVEREADPNDRRIVRIHASAAGRNARQRCRRERIKRLQEALELLCEQELEQVAAGLALLDRALGRSNNDTAE